MAAAVRVENGSLRVAPEAHGAVLMRHSRQRDAFADVGAHVEDVLDAILAMDRARHAAHELLHLRVQALVPFLVVRRVAELDAAVAAQGQPILRLGQILGSEPEVEGVLRHEIQGEARDELRRAGGEHVAIGLADEGDVPHGVLPVLRFVVEVVERQGFLEHRGVRAARHREQHRVQVAHVVASHLPGTVGETLRVAIAGGAQEQSRRVDGAAGDDDEVGAVALRFAVAQHVDASHLAAARARGEPHHDGAGEQRDVPVFQGRIDAADLGIGLRLHQTGMAVAGGAADAAAAAAVLFVQHDAHGHVERPVPERHQAVVQGLDARFMAHRRVPVGSARPGLGGVLAAVAVHVIELLGAGVVGLEVGVGDGPRR